jgi:hypothetical protein
MSQNTRQEVRLQLRRRYFRAGRQHKSQLVTPLVELFGCHRKAAQRTLRPKPVLVRALCPGSAPGIRAGQIAAPRSRPSGERPSSPAGCG